MPSGTAEGPSKLDLLDNYFFAGAAFAGAAGAAFAGVVVVTVEVTVVVTADFVAGAGVCCWHPITAKPATTASAAMIAEIFFIFSPPFLLNVITGVHLSHYDKWDKKRTSTFRLLLMS
jgi:hypothetical protein